MKKIITNHNNRVSFVLEDVGIYMYNCTLIKLTFGRTGAIYNTDII